VKKIKSRKARGVPKPIKQVKGAKKTGKEIRLTRRKIGIILLILIAIAAAASYFVFFYEGELPFISGENATKVNASFIVQNIRENVLLPVKNFFISGLNETNATIAEPVVEEINITKEPLFLSSVFTKIADFFRAYLYYILASVGGLVILAILFFILKKIEKEKITTAKFDRVSGRIILRNNRMAIGEIIIKLNKTLYNAMLVLKKIKKPTFISAGDIVYEYAEVDKKNIENSDMKEVVVRFRVKKSWLRKNNIGRRDVSLRRYINNKWAGVNTAIISEDKRYCYYESILKELSYFAIVGKKIEIKEKPTIAKEPEEVIKPIVKKEEKKTEKKVKRIDYGQRKKFFKFLAVLIFIAVIAGLGYYFRSYIFGALSEIKSFAFIYKWYIISAVSMLAAIFVISYIVKKIKIRFKFKNGVKKRSEIIRVPKPIKEVKIAKRVKRKISRKQKKKIIIGILLGLFFIFIVFGIGYFAYFKQGMDMFRAEGNASEEIIAEEEIADEEAEEIIEKEVIEEEIQEAIIEEETIGIPNQEWHKDSDLEIDLNEYFYDPDEDELYFSAKGLKHMSVSFEDGVATLTPESNWSGTEEAVFSADDGKGGKVESNIVRLTVNDAKEESLFTKKKVSMIFTKIKEYTIVYMNYIIVGIILLVILTLFIKYRKPILDFLEED
ncbi:MAG: PGF-pre-PGF domain-containing protein, partial [Nanoarchaeota archaeon]|nr:PGF-pre-PGF domain-containing protein [Nanoarchaeota archaeon]